jgi:hypothetical protein
MAGVIKKQPLVTRQQRPQGHQQQQKRAASAHLHSRGSSRGSSITALTQEMIAAAAAAAPAAAAAAEGTVTKQPLVPGQQRTQRHKCSKSQQHQRTCTFATPETRHSPASALPWTPITPYQPTTHRAQGWLPACCQALCLLLLLLLLPGRSAYSKLPAHMYTASTPKGHATALAVCAPRSHPTNTYTTPTTPPLTMRKDGCQLAAPSCCCCCCCCLAALQVNGHAAGERMGHVARGIVGCPVQV